jgi:hypothetical protein
MTVRTLVLVLCCVASSPAFAQNATPRGWLDINVVSLQARQDDQTYAVTTELFDETAAAAAAYPPFSSTTGGDFAGGVRFGPGIGFGAHFNRVSYQYQAGVAISIPHPALFNRFAADSDVTDPLKRHDNNLDLLVSYDLPTPDSWRIRLFGGPSYFKVKQQMVEDIDFDQAFSLSGVNIVDITSSTQREVDASAWGFNVGIDVAYFFTRHIGIGGMVRMNRGTVSIAQEPLSGDRAELKAGSTVAGGGVRFRF